jgi:hypothetical protein
MKSFDVLMAIHDKTNIGQHIAERDMDVLKRAINTNSLEVAIWAVSIVYRGHRKGSFKPPNNDLLSAASAKLDQTLDDDSLNVDGIRWLFEALRYGPPWLMKDFRAVNRARTAAMDRTFPRDVRVTATNLLSRAIQNGREELVSDLISLRSDSDKAVSMSAAAGLARDKRSRECDF